MTFSQRNVRVSGGGACLNICEVIMPCLLPSKTPTPEKLTKKRRALDVRGINKLHHQRAVTLIRDQSPVRYYA